MYILLIENYSRIQCIKIFSQHLTSGTKILNFPLHIQQSFEECNSENTVESIQFSHFL